MSPSRSTWRATVGVAAASAALLAAQAGPVRAAVRADDSTATLALSAPDTITPGEPTSVTLTVSNPSTGTDYPDQRLDLELSNVAAIAISDVTVSASMEGTSVPVAISSTDSQDIAVAIGATDGTDVGAGYDDTTAVSVTVDSTFRGPLYLTAQLDTVDSSGNVVDPTEPTAEADNYSAGDQLGTQILKVTPYPHVQDVTLSRPSNGSLYYATANVSGGGSPLQVAFGRSSDVRFGSDLFGSGTAYPVLYRAPVFYVSSFAVQTGADALAVPSGGAEPEAFGRVGDIPIDANFTATDDDNNDLGAFDDLGVFRPSTQTFYFQGIDGGIHFGRAGDIPLVGNWDGSEDGDSIGVYRPSNQTFYLLTESGTITTHFGRSGDKPVVGDWNGNGISLIGVHRGNTFILATSNTAPVGRAPFTFGSASDIATTSSWTYTPGDLLRSALNSASSDARIAKLRASAARTAHAAAHLR